MPLATKLYTQHRLRLLCLASTRGWPAAIYYDTHGYDEFVHQNQGSGPDTSSSRDPVRPSRRGAAPVLRPGEDAAASASSIHHAGSARPGTTSIFTIVDFLGRHHPYFTSLPVVGSRSSLIIIIIIILYISLTLYFLYYYIYCIYKFWK
jgi:hypothetical protein